MIGARESGCELLSGKAWGGHAMCSRRTPSPAQFPVPMWAVRRSRPTTCAFQGMPKKVSPQSLMVPELFGWKPHLAQAE